MNFEYTAMDDMNKKATDVLECPECFGENHHLLHKNTKEEREGKELNWVCLDCNHQFNEVLGDCCIG